MSEKRFRHNLAYNESTGIYVRTQYVKEYYLTLYECCDLLNQLTDKNEQLKNQIKIFEAFLKSNDLDIEWENFCTKEGECPFTNPFTNISCKECIYLKMDDLDE